VVAYFHGRGAAAGRALAQRVCGGLGAALLHADVEAMLAGQDGGLAFGDGLRRLYREALLQGAAVYLSRFDRLLYEPRARALLGELEALLREAAWFTCVEGERLWLPPTLADGVAFLPIALAAPDYRERLARWQGALRAAGAALDEVALGTLAARYRFTAGEIAQAARLALDQARAQGAARPDEPAVRRTCRHYAKARADRLARQTEPRATWDDLLLPPDVRAQLEELCAQVRHRGKVLYEWGFDRRLTLGKGLYALFTGPSGTGKTLAAEVIARALEFDLLKIDLSAVVSKYIGETEKNLQRVFDSADRADCILLFDEADALFGKRSEIKDAHDRYANIEIDFLLQRLEEYEGVAILTSNFAQNIDEAFARRLQFTVEFPFPDERLRLAIWRNHFPKEAPVAADLDLEYFARELKIAGGSIRKIVLNAAFLAADEGEPISASHLLRATRREYERMGKPYLVGQGAQLRHEVQA
jgi:SpoVK/Ycf46/Vps4 family AAA+-type ATPase